MAIRFKEKNTGQQLPPEYHPLQNRAALIVYNRYLIKKDQQINLKFTATYPPSLQKPQSHFPVENQLLKLKNPLSDSYTVRDERDSRGTTLVVARSNPFGAEAAP
ncbi:hypothetical protein KKC1_17240 [Calderihabitans maritimus]|uniref:Uncharacterized protein n=1 Tax=Calderihabitans maritimus TaxID=1246530 RepID=A0A1Z5HSR6_9FIRM|nr:hypothetical protein KKC1_17240 [Calderihabitans maritimus]